MIRIQSYGRIFLMSESIEPHAEFPKKRLRLPMTLMIIGLVILFGGVFGWDIVKAYFTSKYFANFQPPPMVISATYAKSETWHPYLSTIGDVVAINGVNVTPQLAGQIDKIYFESGQTVQVGQSLVKLNTDLDEQDLKNYQAQLHLANLNFQRQSKLYKTKSVAESALDEAKTTLQQDQALVQKTQVTIEQKTIRAPFAGKIGIRQINLGQYVSPGDTIVSLQSLDPLYVNFTLPEQDYPLLYLGQPVTLTVDAYAKENFQGKITAINSEISNDTRNILIQAIIPNPNLKLVPGMFASVDVILPQQTNVITIPQTAISYSLYGDSVFVLTPQTIPTAQNTKQASNTKTIYKATRVYVTIGEERDNVVAITKGLNADQLVATSGQLKLNDGTSVIINNSVDITKIPINNDQLY